MKFINGEWLMREGVCMYDCRQIRQAEILDDGKKLYLYTVSYDDKNKRAVGGVVKEMYITSPLEDIISVKTVHHIGGNKKYPSFDLNVVNIYPNIDIKENGATFTSGKTQLKIGFAPCSFVFYHDGKKIASIGNRFGASLLGYAKTPNGPYMRVKFDVDVEEKIYGLGERFTPFVRNGQSVEIWNEDGGTSTELSYKNIPFYISNRNYGLFVNNTGKVDYEICSESVTKCQVSVPGESLEFMVIGASSMKGVIERYTALTGRPALLPKWSFGLWLSSCFKTSYDEKTIYEMVDGMLERNIPLSVFHIDCFWMKENEWCSFEWDKETFPNPEKFIAGLKERGLRVSIWINPYIGQKSKVFAEAMQKGYLLKRPNGDVWQWDLWQSGQGIVDFTNPNAVKWYKEKLRKLVRMGIDVFKTDFGERIPVDCVYYDGSDPERMHNYYTYIYNKTVYDLLLEEKGENEACLFARSATVGCQKFPVHWGGDCFSEYVSMNESLRGGLSLCMSGFGFWAHDIGGFEGTAPDHLYKRWLAFGLFSTHSRLHGADSYRVPWNFGEESVDVCRFFTEHKKKLLTYLFSNAVETHKTGIPLMRAMILEFQGDLGAEDCDRQYMLGDSLLVAPVMTECGDVSVYLPEGRWTEYFTGKEVLGRGWRKEKHDFFSLPLYVRENTILPKNDKEQLVLEMYAISGIAERSIYNSDGSLNFKVTAKRNDDGIVVSFSKTVENVKIKFINENVTSLDGEKLGDGVAIVKGDTLRVKIY